MTCLPTGNRKTGSKKLILRGKATLRHAGVLVKDLRTAEKLYSLLGFKPVSRERLTVVKMVDSKGKMLELVKGNWHEHIAVNWYEEKSGNYIEVVEEK
jgi:catechol-2,3-dioxygenase